MTLGNKEINEKLLALDEKIKKTPIECGSGDLVEFLHKRNALWRALSEYLAEIIIHQVDNDRVRSLALEQMVRVKRVTSE